MCRQSYSNAPEEILLLVFQYLSTDSLYECQKVCHNWYQPAHLVYLKDVTLQGTINAMQFLDAINCNPKPCYLNAVRQLSFTAFDSFTLDANMSKQLLSRFPNLEQIVGAIPFKILGHEFYESLTDICPRLTKIAKSDGFQSQTYNELLYNLRHVLKEMKLGEVSDEDDYVYLAGGLQKFIGSFHQLQELDVFDVGEFYGFAKCLSLFELLPNLKVLKCSLGDSDDKGDILAGYLKSKKRDDRALLLKRFAQLKHLHIVSINCLSLGLVRFITEHLTGLEQINLMTFFNDEWASSQKPLYYKFLKCICSLSDFDISTKMQNDNVIQACLPQIVYDTLHQSPANMRIQTKILFVSLYEGTPLQSSEKVYAIETQSFRTGKSQIARSVKLSLFSESLEGIGMLQKLHLRDINIFSFVRRMASPQKLYFSILFPILSKLPSVTKIVLEIPPVLTDGNFAPTLHYPHVTYLQLKVYNVIRIPVELSPYLCRFPGVKYLKLTGNWTSSKTMHHVFLKKIELERLDLDITPVKQVLENLDHEFLLRVHILSSQKEYYYKCTFSGLITTKANSDSTCNVTIQITVFSLKCLKLYFQKIPFTGIPYVDDELKNSVETKVIFS